MLSLLGALSVMMVRFATNISKEYSFFYLQIPQIKKREGYQFGEPVLN